ncbi:MAG TPA: hypothetical protein VJS37_03330 [Terriglobales bacterium]|nr:hypothetical protein [Terriglobales bacterium]
MDLLVEFLRDSGGWGVTSEVAGLSVFSVGIWEHFHDKAIAPFILVIISVPLFWAGAFVAWRKKRHDVNRLNSQLEDRKPCLDLNLEGILYVYDPAMDLTVFVLSTYLMNRGEASVAKTWGAWYIVNESAEEMVGFNVRSSYRITMGNEVLTLTNDSLLQSQVMTHRLERGDAKAGRLIFTIPGDRTAQINTRQFRLEVQCHDFMDRPTRAKFIPDSKPYKGIRSFPGEQVQIGSREPETVSYTQPKLNGETKPQ